MISLFNGSRYLVLIRFYQMGGNRTSSFIWSETCKQVVVLLIYPVLEHSSNTLDKIPNQLDDLGLSSFLRIIDIIQPRFSSHGFFSNKGRFFPYQIHLDSLFLKNYAGFFYGFLISQFFLRILRSLLRFYGDLKDSRGFLQVLRVLCFLWLFDIKIHSNPLDYGDSSRFIENYRYS